MKLLKDYKLYRKLESILILILSVFLNLFFILFFNLNFQHISKYFNIKLISMYYHEFFDHFFVSQIKIWLRTMKFMIVPLLSFIVPCPCRTFFVAVCAYLYIKRYTYFNKIFYILSLQIKFKLKKFIKR